MCHLGSTAVGTEEADESEKVSTYQNLWVQWEETDVEYPDGMKPDRRHDRSTSEGEWGPNGQFCRGHTEVGKCPSEEKTFELSLAR